MVPWSSSGRWAATFVHLHGDISGERFSWQMRHVLTRYSLSPISPCRCSQVMSHNKSMRLQFGLNPISRAARLVNAAAKDSAFLRINPHERLRSYFGYPDAILVEGKAISIVKPLMNDNTPGQCSSPAMPRHGFAHKSSCSDNGTKQLPE